MTLIQILSRFGTASASVGARRSTSTQRPLTSSFLSVCRRSNCHRSVNGTTSAPIPAVFPAGKRRDLHTGSNGGIRQRNATVLNQNSRLVVSRIMGLDDTQMFGVVHGGSIMQVMEEAGTILSTQYCNRIGTSLDTENNSPPEEIVTVSGCVENIEFLAPMFVGDLAEVRAEIGFTSGHSVQVLVEVHAKNVVKGRSKLAARGKIWYVPLSRDLESRIMSVPPRSYTRGSPQIQQEGRVGYERLKALRQAISANSELSTGPDLPMRNRIPMYDAVRGTPSWAMTYMNSGIQPSFCWAGEDYIRGGILLKWMDECGSFSTSMHISYYGFTGKVDYAVFLRKATVGGLMSITAKPIFASSKTLDVLIVADELRLEPGVQITRTRTAESVMTYMSPGEDRKPIDMPPITPVTDDEKKLFAERKKLYEERKLQMAAGAAAGKK